MYNMYVYLHRKGCYKKVNVMHHRCNPVFPIRVYSSPTLSMPYLSSPSACLLLFSHTCNIFLSFLTGFSRWIMLMPGFPLLAQLLPWCPFLQHNPGAFIANLLRSRKFWWKMSMTLSCTKDNDPKHSSKSTKKTLYIYWIETHRHSKLKCLFI